MYMQWLLDRDEKRKSSVESSPTLRVAQTSKEYKND